jgi:hypothetical protein
MREAAGVTPPRASCLDTGFQPRSSAATLGVRRMRFVGPTPAAQPRSSVTSGLITAREGAAAAARSDSVCGISGSGRQVPFHMPTPPVKIRSIHTPDTVGLRRKPGYFATPKSIN